MELNQNNKSRRNSKRVIKNAKPLSLFLACIGAICLVLYAVAAVYFQVRLIDAVEVWGEEQDEDEDSGGRRSTVQRNREAKESRRSGQREDERADSREPDSGREDTDYLSKLQKAGRLEYASLETYYYGYYYSYSLYYSYDECIFYLSVIDDDYRSYYEDDCGWTVDRSELESLWDILAENDVYRLEGDDDYWDDDYYYGLEEDDSSLYFSFENDYLYAYDYGGNVDQEAYQQIFEAVFDYFLDLEERLDEDYPDGKLSGYSYYYDDVIADVKADGTERIAGAEDGIYYYENKIDYYAGYYNKVMSTVVLCPQLEGTSAAVIAINDTLQKSCEALLEQQGERALEAAEYWYDYDDEYDVSKILSFYCGYEITAHTSRYISFLLEGGAYQTGGPVDAWQEAFVFDLATGKRLTVDDVLDADSQDIRELLLAEIEKNYPRDGEDSYLYYEALLTIYYDSEYETDFYLSGNGVTFYYKWEDDYIEVTLPYQKTKL